MPNKHSVETTRLYKLVRDRYLSRLAMNAFDFVVLAAVVFGAIHGLRNGLLTMVTSLVALIAALYLASVHYSEAASIIARQLGSNPTLATVLGYVAVFLVVFVVDHVVRPYVIGGATQIPFLLVLLGILGGLSSLGLVGLFVGPAIMAIFTSVWRDLVMENDEPSPEHSSP